MSDDKIGLTFKCTKLGDRELESLDSIANGSGEVRPGDVREIAKLLAIVSRQANATVGLLQRIASVGSINISS